MDLGLVFPGGATLSAKAQSNQAGGRIVDTALAVSDTGKRWRQTLRLSYLEQPKYQLIGGLRHVAGVAGSRCRPCVKFQGAIPYGEIGSQRLVLQTVSSSLLVLCKGPVTDVFSLAGTGKGGKHAAPAREKRERFAWPGCWG